MPEHHKGQYALDVWHVGRCSRCGLIYENPQPDDDALGKFYSFDTDEDRAFVDAWFVGEAEHLRTVWRRYLAALRRYATRGLLLDVGCGAGSFLDEAQKCGFMVMGQDISDFFVRYCRETYGIDIFAGDVQELANMKQSQFDVVTALDVIEHHPQPRQLLQAIRSLLKPGGIVAISTHDIGNFFARQYGAKWRHLHFAHLTYFNRANLTSLLQQTGFEVVKIGGIHTIDGSAPQELRNYIVQFFRVVVLRYLILRTYLPLTRKFPALARWRIKLGRHSLTHERVLVRLGSQVILNDDMVVIARAI